MSGFISGQDSSGRFGCDVASRDDGGHCLTRLDADYSGEECGCGGGSGDLTGELHPPVHEAEGLPESLLGDEDRLDAVLEARLDAVPAGVWAVEAVGDRFRLDGDRFAGF